MIKKVFATLKNGWIYYYLTMDINKIYNRDCIEALKEIANNSVDLVLTDIPYGKVNRESNGLRDLDKGKADIVTFDVEELTKTLCDKTKGSIYMFCATEQLSTIRKTMVEKGLSTRLIIWEKTCPDPLNGDHIWLSGIECCVYGKKKGATFNLHCKNTVLRYPNGTSKIHPTQKPVNLFRYLIQASSNEGDLVLDPFMGSGTTAVASFMEKRNFIGFELCKEFFDRAKKRVETVMTRPMLDFNE